MRDTGTVLITAALLVGVLLAVVFPAAPVRWVVLIACGLVSVRALLSAWALGFVQPGQRLEAAAGRLPLYLAGGVASAGLVTLLF